MNRPKRPNRVQWNVDDLTTLAYAALGQSMKRIEGKSGLTPHKARYRMSKVSVKITDFRNAIPGTVGGDLARKLLAGEAFVSIKRAVEDRIPKDLPTKKRARHTKKDMPE